jgi:hypothetical protein
VILYITREERRWDICHRYGVASVNRKRGTVLLPDIIVARIRGGYCPY